METRVRFESLLEKPLPAERADRLAAGAAHEVVFGIGARRIAVRFSRASAAARFAERFGDLLAAGPAETIVHAVEEDGSAYFWLTPDRARQWTGPLDDDLFAFFADNLALYEFFATTGAAGIHAAVIASRSHLIALAGVSTAGKTTTAIAALRYGFTLYSDERCIIDEGVVVPFLRAMTLRPGGRSALTSGGATAGAVDRALRALPAERESELRPRALAGERAGGPARPLDALFVIDGRASEPEITACSRFAVVSDLARSLSCREAGLDRMARLLREMKGVATFRLRLGTPDRTVEEIAAVLG
jgi:hypothetical protein